MDNWFYVRNGERQGPTSESEIRSLLANNKIDMETLVWNESMENWEPASRFFSGDAPPAPSPSPSAGNRCNECGLSFPEDQLSVFGGQPTCQRCLKSLERRAREQSSGRPYASTTHPATGSNNMAVISLVLTIANIVLCAGILSIPAIICGIMGYSHANKVNGEGKGIALASIIISSLVLIPFLIFAGIFFFAFLAAAQ